MAYFASRPKPIAVPNTIAQPKPGFRTPRHRANNATDQKNNKGVSVEMIPDEKLTAGSVKYRIAAHMPPRAPAMSRPSRYRTAAVPACSRGAPSRTAPSPLPNRAVVAAITHAIIGGFEKYPHAKSRDQNQYCASSPAQGQGGREQHHDTQRRQRQNREKGDRRGGQRPLMFAPSHGGAYSQNGSPLQTRYPFSKKL